MERAMAISSQILTHGGMRSRDWFSDKLEKRTKKNLINVYLEKNHTSHHLLWLNITCWERWTSQWWPAQTGPWSWERNAQRSSTRLRWSPHSQGSTAWSETVQRRGGLFSDCLQVCLKDNFFLRYSPFHTGLLLNDLMKRKLISIVNIMLLKAEPLYYQSCLGRQWRRIL